MSEKPRYRAQTEKHESLRHRGEGTMVDVDGALMPGGAEKTERAGSDAIQEKPNFKEPRMERRAEPTAQAIDGLWRSGPNG